MHRDVDSPCEQSLLDFLGKQALPTDFREWHTRDRIASGFDYLDGARFAQCVQPSFNPVSLPQCQLRAARTNSDHSVSEPENLADHGNEVNAIGLGGAPAEFRKD